MEVLEMVAHYSKYCVTSMVQAYSIYFVQFLAYLSCRFLQLLCP